MKKLITFIAACCLIPSLSFASKLTDIQYRNNLTQNPIWFTQSFDGFSGVYTFTFKNDNTFTEHVDAYLTSTGTHMVLDMSGNWSINNAILSYRFTNGSYQKTSDPQTNKALEDAKNTLIAQGEQSLDLDSFESSASRSANKIAAGLHIK